MNMVEQIVGQCFKCEVTTKKHRSEPVKMTVTLETPLEIIAAGFGGPYPDGHYNLVVVDKRSRYPEVETTYLTAVKPNTKRLNKMFATHGTPKQLNSDNGPLFGSEEFAKFAKGEGFHHHRVTSEHPRTNGEVENLMNILNKRKQIANLQRQDREVAVQNTLTGCQSTPHPATGIARYEGMINQKV